MNHVTMHASFLYVFSLCVLESMYDPEGLCRTNKSWNSDHSDP